MLFLRAICVIILFNVVFCDIQDDVKFYLSTEDQNRTLLTEENLDLVDTDDPTIILIHGWSQQSNVSWVIELTDELLAQDDYNVIAVDYTPIAEADYITAVADSKEVGQYAGELIANLYSNYSANLNDFHVIGHSLGGQIAGFVGKAVQNLTGLNVSRITGLDPAGPLFLPTDPEGRLASSDADLIVVLHTDGFAYGYYYEVGGIDFYANGGTSVQPGCLLGDLTTARCSHDRSTDYYKEAVLNPDGFVATECSDYLLYELGTCSGNRNITLGGNFTQAEYGKYYFTTNSESPYSKE